MSDPIEKELLQALALVERAAIPNDLRPVAFASAFWVAREATAPAAQDDPIPPGLGGAHIPDSIPATKPEGSWLEGIAAKLNVSGEDVEFVYELEGDRLALRVPPSRLAPVLRDAVTQIIYLVAAGRQAGGFASKTPAREIKAISVECGKADTNFSRILAALHGEGLIIGGSGQTKTVRVNADGFERTGEIIQRLRTSNA